MAPVHDVADLHCPARSGRALTTCGITHDAHGVRSRRAVVAKLANAPDLNSGALTGLWVRSPPTAPALTAARRSAHDALPPDGAFIIIENLIDDERRENVFGLMMSLNMLIEFDDAFEYTGADFRGWCADAGFRWSRSFHSLAQRPPSPTSDGGAFDPLNS